MADNRGYVKLARKSVNSEIWNKPPLYWKVWCYILMKASHQDTEKLKRGEAIITVEELVKACSYNVGYRIVSPTPKQIRSILDFLRFPSERTTNGRMIVTTKVTDGTLVKVLNYGKYQDSENYEGNYEGSTKSSRTGEQGQILYNKNDKKNYKNIYNISSDSTTLAKLVIDYLNQKTGKAYRYSNASMKHIIARLNDGFTLEDCKKVIDNKVADWKGTNYEQYIRPETLFTSKFETYLNQTITKKAKRLPDYMQKGTLADDPWIKELAENADRKDA